jgi:hypothetical protein
MEMQVYPACRLDDPVQPYLLLAIAGEERNADGQPKRKLVQGLNDSFALFPYPMHLQKDNPKERRQQSTPPPRF